MARPKKVTDGGMAVRSSRAPGVALDLHRKQQEIIFNDLNTARQKLEEENQLLRDELSEAKMIIRLLKMKLDEKAEPRAKATASPVNSNDHEGISARFFKAVERTKKRRYLFKQKSSSRRDAFRNPVPPGSKAFTPRHSVSPPRQKPRLSSPRSTFSPILGGSEARHPMEPPVPYNEFKESMVQEVVTKLQRAQLS